MFHCFKFNGDIQLQAINMKFKLITNIFPDNLDDHGNTLLKVHAYKNNWKDVFKKRKLLY